MKLIILTTLIFFIYTKSSYAYLDPGTSSILFSSAITLLFGFLYLIKSFLYKIVLIPNKIFGIKIKYRENFDIVFYNEGNQYFSTFYPILKEIKKRDIQFTYLYSEKADLIIKKIDNIESHYIGMGNKAFFYLNTLQANMCIMTTPGLGLALIKRSKGVKHYCNINHAKAGLTGGKVFEYDCFDSLLASNEEDKKFLLKLEEIRNLPKKDIRIVGTPYLDHLRIELNKINIKENKKYKNILVSPTWGERGLLYRYGESIIPQLLGNKDFNLIIRPHPQDVRYKKKMLEKLKLKYKSENIYWDYSDNPLKSMAMADIMISDTASSIIFDFILLFFKPVVAIQNPLNNDGRDYINKNDPYWYIKFYEDLNIVIDDNSINRDILSIIEKKIGGMNNIYNKELLEKIDPFSGESATKTVDAILDIKNNLNNNK
jgi:hypothetical protein